MNRAEALSWFILHPSSFILYLAYSTARVSRTTVTLISPG
jgi:hypothetical protein